MNYRKTVLVSVKISLKDKKLFEFYFRRQIKKSKSVIQLLLFNENTENDIKSKNIKQTELLVDLREGILQIARHFVQFEPKVNSEVLLIADYSMESHSTDHSNYINVSKNRKRRAKALLGK